MTTETLKCASEIWGYMSAVKSRSKSDAIVICCSYDLRACDHACALIKDGLSDTLVISGKHGNWTRHLWDEAEAEVFLNRAIANGIDENQILLEPEATNFGENILYSRALIPKARSITFVSKPNSLLRIKLTAEARCPEIEVKLSCPDINFPSEVSNIVGVWGVINEMVGDIERIQKYPDLGFQVPHKLPDGILQNWAYLVDQGFTSHLMPDNRLQSERQKAAADAPR